MYSSQGIVAGDAGFVSFVHRTIRCTSVDGSEHIEPARVRLYGLAKTGLEYSCKKGVYADIRSAGQRATDKKAASLKGETND